MRRDFLTLYLILACPLPGAITIDRIAVIVGKHAIKASEIDRDIRLTDFLNAQPLSETTEDKRKSADRLIDQELIREDLATGGYGRATDADADAMMRQIRQRRYGGSEERLRQALTRYGLTEDELRAQLLWQLTALKFIDERFRAGVFVTDDEVRKYYDEHSELHNRAFSAAEPDIRKTLEGQQVNTQLDQWLKQARQRQDIKYREAAFQ
jgi:hypothetical protein